MTLMRINKKCTFQVYRNIKIISWQKVRKSEITDVNILSKTGVRRNILCIGSKGKGMNDA